MTHFETIILLEFLMPIIIAVSIYFLERKIDQRFKHQEAEDKKRHDEYDRKAALRRDAVLVISDMSEAAMELAYATSVAVENGKTNGEMKKARALYEKAKDEKTDYINKLKAEVTK